MGTAHLTREIPAERAVAAIIPRQEIINALQDPEASPELTLQVATASGDATSTIGIEWSRDELEQLLRGIDSDNVVLTLDSDELQWAFDDVEAHGLRQRALIFTVAAAGALGSGATIANAMPMSGPGAGGAAAVPVAQVQASSSVVADAPISNAHTPGLQIGDAGSTASARQSVQASSSVIADAPMSNVHTPGLQIGDGGSTAAARQSVQVSSPSVADAPMSNVHTPGLQIGDSESTAATPSVQASSADSTVSDAASGAGYVAPTSTSHETFGIQLPAGSVEGLLAGGALLVIAGATFASRRMGSARPA